MSVDIDAVASGIKTALETIPTLKGRVWEYVPERVTVPCAVVALGGGDWETMDDAERVDWQILVLVSLASAKDAQKRLRAYLRRDGAESLKAALEADETLGGACATDNAGPWETPDGYDLGGQSYLGVILNLQTFG